jgi:hypothetical protein
VQPPPLAGTSLGGESEAASWIGHDQVAIGQEWLFALPLPYNKSAKDLTITRAEVIDLPPGTQLTGMSAHALRDTDDSVIGLALAGSSDMTTKLLAKAKNVVDKPVTVKPRSLSDVYYVARIKVTGKIAKEVERCRFEYEQDGKHYAQVIGCRLKLTLKP